jgi:hypothetical protein
MAVVNFVPVTAFFQCCNRALHISGKYVSAQIAGLLGVVLIVGIPAGGIFVALFVGVCAAKLIGGGGATLCVVTFIVIGLLSIYVWQDNNFGG